MIYRAFRCVTSGRWVDVIMTCDDEAFPADGDVQAGQLAQLCGLEGVEWVDGPTDPREGDLIGVPNTAAVPRSERIAAASTLAELKDALLGEVV